MSDTYNPNNFEADQIDRIYTSAADSVTEINAVVDNNGYSGLTFEEAVQYVADNVSHLETVTNFNCWAGYDITSWQTARNKGAAFVEQNS